MDTKEVEKLIRNLGYTYQALVDNKIIPNIHPAALYGDSDTLEIELESGFELVFNKEFLRFEMIHLSRIVNESKGLTLFSDMPYPINEVTSKAQARLLLGEPIITASDLELLETDLYGWDTYQLSQNLHPAAMLEFQYDSKFDTVYLTISLMDR